MSIFAVNWTITVILNTIQIWSQGKTIIVKMSARLCVIFTSKTSNYSICKFRFCMPLKDCKNRFTLTHASNLPNRFGRAWLPPQRQKGLEPSSL